MHKYSIYTTFFFLFCWLTFSACETKQAETIIENNTTDSIAIQKRLDSLQQRAYLLEVKELLEEHDLIFDIEKETFSQTLSIQEENLPVLEFDVFGKVHINSPKSEHIQVRPDSLVIKRPVKQILQVPRRDNYCYYIVKTTKHDYSHTFPRIQDINLDGYLDIGLFKGLNDGRNILHEFFLFDSNNRRFYFTEDFSKYNLEFDPKTQIFTTKNYYDNYLDNYYKTYFKLKSGKLVSYAAEEQKFIKHKNHYERISYDIVDRQVDTLTHNELTR